MFAGDDYYVDKFKAVLDDDGYGKNVKEVCMISHPQKEQGKSQHLLNVNHNL